MTSADGKPAIYFIQQPKLFRKLSPQDRKLIEGITYTEKGRPNLRTVPKLAASIELRKMLGLDAPAKSDVNLGGNAIIQVVSGVPRAPNEP